MKNDNAEPGTLNRSTAVKTVFEFVKDAHPYPDRYKSWLEGLADERLQYFYGLVRGVAVKLILIAVLGLGSSVLADGHRAGSQDRWSALADIESGGNDRAVGRAGEVSRFQIKPCEWRRASSAPLSRATVSATALAVTRQIQSARCRAFAARFHRAPTDWEFYVLWNAPNQLLLGNTGTVSTIVRERAERFANLVNRA